MASKLDAIKEEVKTLYEQSADECMRKWFFDGHMMVVANHVQEIAQKAGANIEIAILAALFLYL